MIAMQVHAYRCDAPGCTKTTLVEDEMITATVTLKATEVYERRAFKVHACSTTCLGKAVAERAEE